MSVLRESGSVWSVWVERLRGLGATQPSGPFDQTDFGFDALDHPGYICDVTEQVRGQTSQRVAGRPGVGPAGRTLARVWPIFCTFPA